MNNEVKVKNKYDKLNETSLMFKLIFKYNIFSVVLLVGLFIFSIVNNDAEFGDVIKHASMTVLIPYYCYVFLFFIIPAHFMSISFAFMFIAVGVKFLLTGTFFSLALINLPQESIMAFTGLFITLFFMPYISEFLLLIFSKNN